MSFLLSFLLDASTPVQLAFSLLKALLTCWSKVACARAA
jgi:hypothetical protein